MTQDSSQPAFWDTRYRDHVMPWDAGGVPADLRAFADTLPKKARVLIPGCGSGHEVLYLAEREFDVLAIDFSSAAVELADHIGGEIQIWIAGRHERHEGLTAGFAEVLK
jgi:SAM-dependent methyltransferase